MLLAQVVAQSINAASVCMLIALILGIVYVIWSLMLKAFPAALLGAAIVFIALGLLFFV